MKSSFWHTQRVQLRWDVCLLTVKALWTSSGWGRVVKSILMPLLLSSLGSASDESRLHRPKAEGFRPANSQERTAVTDSRQRRKLFKQLPWDQEGKKNVFSSKGGSRSRGFERKEKEVMWDGLKSTIRTQSSALSFCCMNKEQNTLVW